VRHEAPPARRITLTAGFEGTTRALVARALAAELTARGTECEVLAEGSSQSEVESLQTGAVDFVLVSAIHHAEHRDPAIRLVAPLHLEALHLLVKRELAGLVSEGIASLAGHSVDLGPDGEAGADLAADVLAFAGLVPGADGPGRFEARHLELGDLEAQIGRGARAALPDAVLHLATMPSLLAQKLVREAGYVVVPLPFAEAFRLQGVLAAGDPGRERRLATEAVIPPFLYQAEPAVPAAPLPTLGARLLLLAHERVSAATVERVLEAAFDTRFARMFHPGLDRAHLAALPRHELHPGAIAYLDDREPAITGEAVDDLSNSLSVVGALLGGGAFLLQGWRQHQRARREQIVADHLLRVAEVERRIVESELSASLDLDALIAVQRELLTLKSEALERFTSGVLDDRSLLSNLLDPIDAARAHVGELLLHVRVQLEGEAKRAGHSSSAVWNEAAGETAEAKPAP
jgi:TRAP-type uncharacterized transport system substrate-binding protein